MRLGVNGSVFGSVPGKKQELGWYQNLFAVPGGQVQLIGPVALRELTRSQVCLDFHEAETGR